ncbi:hypothetical protein PVW48_08470 [Dinoroseobacter sp. PD6]|uniref:hypothetical protein n=1 Tax=Dinoroseobacter sp. PD6 TaxID=3028384 RepID=UPI00237B4B33|nr:hypothetical protein [Dinoroseobacter sp. PD6]MDD9716774.1 hypothetical protein [Dinoroseobacter sp. PD6]
MANTKDALLAIALADLQAAQAKTDAAQIAQKRALNSLSKVLHSHELDAATPRGNAHLANHRTGVPAKIDSDPELEAFLMDRIHNTGFVQLAAEVAEHFPPERRVGKSAINDWWNRKLRPDLT